MQRSAKKLRPPLRSAAWAGLAVLGLAGGAAGAGPGPDIEGLLRQVRVLSARVLSWYQATPATDRVAWGGLAAGAGLGLAVMAERWLRTRRRRVAPAEFMARFLERTRDGKLDRGKALDLCEMNACPASRVALAAVRRWGRPAGDLERAVALACKVESDRLRRGVGTLRRIAALAPLLGLLGTLLAASRLLAAGAAVGPALGEAMATLTAGVALSILALVAYDGLAGRVEGLANALDRFGAEAVDAIAQVAPAELPRATRVAPRPRPG